MAVASMNQQVNFKLDDEITRSPSEAFASEADNIRAKSTTTFSGSRWSLSASDILSVHDDEEDDKISRGSSWSVKNTFVHVDAEESSDYEDDLCLPVKSKSSPIIELKSDKADAPLPVLLPLKRRTAFAPSEEKGDDDVSVAIAKLPSPCRSQPNLGTARTPRVRFDLTPKVHKFCGEAEEEKALQKAAGDEIETSGEKNSKEACAESDPTNLLELPDSLPVSWNSCNVRVKNTFVHVEADEAEDAEDDLPTRSISVPNMRTPANSLALCDSPMSASSLRRHSSAPAEATFSLPNAPAAAAAAAPATRASVGSVLHGTGRCKPCAWFWKPQSCRWGAECGHCHECPEGELRRRKKEKIAGLKLDKQLND